MDTLIKEYRIKHKRCKWCKYEKLIVPPLLVPCPSYQECILKDKVTKDYKAIFCKYYRLKEDE